MCIGQNLALLEAKLTLAVLLRRFELARSPNYVHAPTVLMLLYPQHGAPVIFRPVAPPPRPATGMAAWWQEEDDPPMCIRVAALTSE
jgi:PHYB activation tagged suppressor 1